MADLGNQLEGVAGGLERLSEGFDNLLIKLTSTSALESKMIKEKQDINKQLSKIDKQKAKEEKKALPLHKKMTIQLQQRLKNTTLLNKGLKDTVKGMNLLGKSMTAMNKVIGTVGTGLAGMGKAGVIAGMVVGVKFLIEGLLKVDSGMAGMSKRLGVTRKELTGVKQGIMGITAEWGEFGVTSEQGLAEFANLAQQFGSLKYVTKSLVDESLKLQKVYGVSAQASGEFLEVLQRSGNVLQENNNYAKDFVLNIGARATKAGVLSSLVMRDMASQTKQIAIQSSRGLESMKTMAIEAAKFGGSLQDFNYDEVYGSIENISSAMLDASMALGTDVNKIMGDAFNLRQLWERGETDEILKRTQQVMRATLELDKEGNIVRKDGMAFGRSQQMAASKAAAMSEDAWVLMTKEVLAKEKADAKEAKARALMKKDERKAYDLKKKRAKDVAAAEKVEENRQKQVLIDQQDNFQRLKSVASGVFENIALAFSAALGVDSTAKGSISGQIEKLSKNIKQIFRFEDLQRDIAAGGGGISGFATAISTRLKDAFNKQISGFATDISTRIKDAFNKQFVKMFPELADEFTKGGMGLDGITAAISGRIYEGLRKGISSYFGVDIDKLDVQGLAKVAGSTAAIFGAVGASAKALSMIKGTWLNPMVVEIKGGAGAIMDPVGGGGGKKGAARKGFERARAGGAGIVASLTRGISGAFKGNKTFRGILSAIKGLGGGGTKSIVAGLFKRIPFLGTAIAAMAIVPKALDSLNATTEEQKEIANKQLIETSGQFAGMASGGAIGAAIGTAILPGIGTAIGGILGAGIGGWLGNEAGKIIADNMNIIKGWFQGPIEGFESWIDDLKNMWNSISNVAADVWSIGKSVFNIAGVKFDELVASARVKFDELAASAKDFVKQGLDWVKELTGWDVRKDVSDAFTKFGNFFTWETMNKILKVVFPSYGALAEGPALIGKAADGINNVTTSLKNWLWSAEESITGTSERIQAIEEAKARVAAHDPRGTSQQHRDDIAYLKEQEVEAEALGGIHRRGGAAIVGEAGGEVVASRSALRSGIGVGGRAATELASIGVPGFYRGGMVEGVTNTQGLMTGLGSESSRGAQASAYRKEQAIQQAAMVNYWREYYENKLQNMGGRPPDDKDKKKDDLDWLKKFFNENKKDIDQVAKILLKNQGPASKEMYKGVFTAMTAWSSGTKAKDALKLGVRAGLTESMKKGGTVYNLFERSNEAIGKLINSQSKATAAMGIAMQSMSVGIQSAMATYAQTGDWGAAKEGMKRSAVSGGVTMLANKLLGEESMATAKQFLAGGGTGAASGKYVNSPTLMMVGEENRGEVVIPTERIKKGLPINAGVARELGSIGVPGFHKGGVTGKADPKATAKKAVKAASVGGSDAMLTLIEDDFDIGSISQLDNAEWAQHTVAPSASSVNNPAAGLADDVFSMKSADAAQTGKPPSGGFMSGLAGGAKASGAAAALSFAQVYMQTGNVRLAAQAGLEAGISLGATLAISAIPIPGMQLVGPIVGPMIGKYTAGPLGRAIGLTGGQKKARKRVLKNIEQHVKSGGIFDFGQPGGMRKNISVAVGGKENVPQEKDYNKLVEHVGGSQVLKPLWQAGIDPSVLVAAGSGKLRGPKAYNSFAVINKALYGDVGEDKYRKALAIPQLADGGIVTKPTTAVIGEAGPEMVIPLHEQKETNAAMIKELKKQNELMQKMIKTQIETGKTEVRLDGRVIAESTADNFYDMGNGV